MLYSCRPVDERWSYLCWADSDRVGGVVGMLSVIVLGLSSAGYSAILFQDFPTSSVARDRCC